MKKQRSKHRSIISMLNKIFGNHFTAFDILADAATNYIKFFSLPWINAINIHVCLLHSLFLSFFSFFFLAFLFVYLFLWLSCYYCFSVTIFLSIYLYLFILLWVRVLCYNFTVISYFSRNWHPVYNLALLIYFLLLIILIIYIYIYMYIYIYIFKYI